MANTIHDKIISFLHSTELTDTIRKSGHKFSPKELAELIYLYSPTYDDMLSLWEELGNTFPETENFTRQNILWKRTSLEKFKEHEENSVYELRIRDKRDNQDEIYFCSSFDSAIKAIDAFYKEYEGITEECKDTVYTILKHHMYFGQDDVLPDNIPGKAVFGQGKILRSIENESVKYSENCDGICVNCTIDCIYDTDVEYPNFIRDFAPIKIHGESDWCSGEYGIVIPIDKNKDTVQEYYTIILNPSFETYDDMQEYCFRYHEHISPGNIEIISYADLTEEHRKAFDTIKEYWAENFSKMRGI